MPRRPVWAVARGEISAMNFEKYTERARGFVQSAQSLAMREGNQQFTPEHLLKVLLDDDQGLAAGLIDKRRRALARRARRDRAGAGQAAESRRLRRGPGLCHAAFGAPLRQRRKDRREGGRLLCDGRAPAARARHGEESRSRQDPRKGRRHAAEPQQARSRNCARAAPPTMRRRKTPMTR